MPACKPILFSSEMVKAILAGRKTQTRRVVQPLISKITYEPKDAPAEVAIHQRSKRGTWNEFSVSDFVKRCPYGQVGDRLWVRETWAAHPMQNKVKPRDLPKAYPYIYKADFSNDNRNFWWRPSIHMPRWASRILLEVVNVRVERVQEISRDDARAEGVSNIWKYRGEVDKKYFRRSVLNPYVANYSVLWDEINAARGFGWEVNPWVWVIEFKRVEVDHASTN